MYVNVRFSYFLTGSVLQSITSVRELFSVNIGGCHSGNRQLVETQFSLQIIPA